MRRTHSLTPAAQAARRFFAARPGLAQNILARHADLAERLARTFPPERIDAMELVQRGEQPPTGYVFCPIRDCFYHPESPALIAGGGPRAAQVRSHPRPEEG